MTTTVDIDLDNVPNINISGVYTGHSWGLVLQQFEDDDATPVNYTGVYALAVFRDATRKDRILLKPLTASTNNLPIGQTKSENKFSAGIYYFDVYDDVDIDNSYPAIRGTIKVTASR